MARTNTANIDFAGRAPENAPTMDLMLEQQLRESILACEGRRGLRIQSIPRIAALVPKVPAEKVAAFVIEAREQMKLCHAPLFVVREMARHKTHRVLVAGTLARVAQQPEDLIEFVAMYWKDGRIPLATQAKKGLAQAFPKFDEQQLAKCKPKSGIKLRDVLFLSHAKPRDEAQAAVWKRLIWGRLRKTPIDT